MLGGLGTFAAFVVVATLFPAVRWAGLGWLVLGMVVYVVYRKRQGLPLTKTVFADTKVRGPAIEIEYRTIVLHVTDARVADEMTATALRLASERRARVVAVYALEVPTSRPLSQIAPEDEERANRQLAEAEALGQLYGVQVISRLVRTRNAGRALVEEAERRGSEIIVLGSPGPLGALGAPLRLDGGLRPAPRPLQGDGRRDARVARRGTCRRAGSRRASA